MKNYQGVLGAFLVGAAIFIIFNYTLALKEKHRLNMELTQTKAQMGVLENEKQNLLQDLEKEKMLQAKLAKEKARLNEHLAAAQERLGRLFKDFSQAKRETGRLEAEVSALSDENNALKVSLTEANRERDSLQRRLNSPEELKKAIRELKKKEKQPSFFGIFGPREAPRTREAVKGNEGFLIRDGVPTPSEKVKIEVAPAAN